MLDELLQAFSGPGAGFMYAITAVLAFGLAIVVERGWLFWIRWRVDDEAILSKVEEGALAEAMNLAGAHPVSRLLAVGGAVKGGAEAAWEAIEGEAPLVESTVRRRVHYLATVGNIATMLGLLGTVYGLILAFSGLSDASAVERATHLSTGIATAMSTTAWGLLVGIPALAAHALLEGKASRVLALCEAVAGRIAAWQRR